MPGTIAVYVGENGETVSLSEKGKLVVFAKQQEAWHKLREKSFELEKITSLKHLRLKMDEIITFLGDCNIFVGNSVVGIPYYMLEKAQKNVWECMGKPLEFINDILEKEEAANLSENMQEPVQVNIVPVEISPGNYRISLKEIQKAKGQLTSKQVLIPFLQKGEFTSLEILGNHVPMWLSGFCLKDNLNMQELETGPGQVKVLVTKQVN
ncbi:MAG: Fe-only nitrogenase accessory AnfO family protein [Peptococcaceae bacterium]